MVLSFLGVGWDIVAMSHGFHGHVVRVCRGLVKDDPPRTLELGVSYRVDNE